MTDASSVFDGLKKEDYDTETKGAGSAARSAKMVYEYKNAKRVDNTVEADLSKLQGRSVVVTGGTFVSFIPIMMLRLACRCCRLG